MVNFQIVSLLVPPYGDKFLLDPGGMFRYRYRKVSTDGEGYA